MTEAYNAEASRREEDTTMNEVLTLAMAAVAVSAIITGLVLAAKQRENARVEWLKRRIGATN